MDYKIWYEQYYKQEIILKDYIKKLKEKAKTKGPTEASDIHYRVSLLYSMYLEVKHIGRHIKKLEEGRTENEK